MVGVSRYPFRTEGCRRDACNKIFQPRVDDTAAFTQATVRTSVETTGSLGYVTNVHIVSKRDLVCQNCK